MQLARLGEIGAIQKLFDGGKFDATYKDDQGITPLHVRTSIRVRHKGDAKIVAVGGYQQPLCSLPLPHTGRRADQCERRRCCSYTCAVGSEALQLLHREPPPRPRRRPAPYRRPRLQLAAFGDSRRQCLPASLAPTPGYTCGYTRSPVAHAAHVGSIQGLPVLRGFVLTLGRKRVCDGRPGLHRPALGASQGLAGVDTEASRVRRGPVRKEQRRQDTGYDGGRNEHYAAMASRIVSGGL